jgi:excisionase family DNA binding protein
VLRAEPALFGPVASDPVISRLVARLAGDAPAALAAIAAARASARERAWQLAGATASGADGGLVPVDIDATIVTAHSDKQHATPRYRLLTVAQVAEVLGTSERFPRRLIDERRIRFVRVGRHVRIPESALREFIAAGLVKPITVGRKRKAA